VAVEIVEPSENEECCCCGSSGIRLNKYKSPLGPTSDGETHQHCDICYETMSSYYCGTSISKSQSDYERSETMKHVCRVGNMILKELRKTNAR
jgi:hypothetical protein